MPVFRVAWSNVMRKLSRSIITLVAMAVAAAVLTAGMSLSKGTAKSAFDNYRTYFEADIVVFTPGFIGASPINQTGGTMVRNILLDSGFNPLLQLYPDFKQQGYLSDSSWAYRPFTPIEVDELGAKLGVSSVQSHRLMPAAVGLQTLGLRPVPEGYASYLSQGRAPQAGAQRLEVVINAYGGLKAQLGDIIELSVPSYSLDSDGIPFVDATQAATIYEASVVGLVSWPSRALHFPGEAGITKSEDAFIHSSEVYLATEDWHSIWEQQSGAVAYPALSLRLKVGNMAELSAVALELKKAHPRLAVFTVQDMVEHGWRYGLLDRFYEAPAWMWAGETSSQPLAQEDFSKITAILLFVNAGMLLASQMLAAVASRRNEIGVLKAIGARSREVTVMILIEASLLAVIGASAGFMIMRLAALHQAMTNGVPALKLLAETLQELGLVLGLTVGCALLFGIMPAWVVSRLTVMEVFRRD